MILLWAGVVVFIAMGSTYDDAVMASGYVGLGLGVTPAASDARLRVVHASQ